MQTNKQTAAADPLFPSVPSDYYARMEAVLDALPVKSRSTVRIPKKRRLWILAAALAALLAVGTAVAVSMSTKEQLQDVVEQRIEASDDERYEKARALAAERIDEEGYPHLIPLEGIAQLDGVLLNLVSIQIEGDEAELCYTLESDSVGFVDVLNDPEYRESKRTQQILSEYDTFCALGEDACDFTLRVSETDYPAYHGDTPSAAGFDKETGVCTTRFLNFPRKLENGTNLVFSGKLYRYDKDGVRLGEIGTFSVPFVYNYTAELRELEIQKMAQAYMEVADARDAETHDSLTGVLADAARLDTVVGLTTYLDAAVDEQGILLGLTERYKGLGWIDYSYFCMDGYDVADDEIACEFSPDKESQTKLLRLPYYADRSYLPDVVTIGCVRSFNKMIPLQPEGWMHSDEFDDYVFVFRCNLKTGEVTLPKDEQERDAWFTPHQFPIDGDDWVYSFKGRYDARNIEDVSMTQNGTDVQIRRVAFTQDGRLCIVYRVDNLACEVIAWETVPKTVRINGVEVKADQESGVRGFHMEDERIAEFLDTYDMSKTRGLTNWWELKLPKRRDMYDGPITIEIEGWDLYDLNKQGERELVGTFGFTFTIPVDDASYGLMSAGNFMNLRENPR